MTTVALAQIRLSNDLEKNVASHIRMIESVDADLIVFPECSITGYDLEHLAVNISQLVVKVEFAREILHNVCKKSGKMALIGLTYATAGKVFNGSLVVGGVDNDTTYYRKRHLTNEEQVIFQPGENALVVHVKKKSIGILICRDQSHPAFFDHYADRGANLIIIQSAHYYSPLDCLKKRHKNIAIPIVRAMDSGVTVAKVNAVGELGGKLSCGNSIVVDPSGNVLGMLGETEEGYLIHKI